MFPRELVSPIVKYAHNSLGLIITGSYLREAANVNDLDFFSYDDPKFIISNFKYPVSNILALGDKVAYFNIEYKGLTIPINIWKITSKNKITQHFSRDYDRQLNIAARRIGKNKGLKLTANEIINLSTGEKFQPKNIKELFSIIGIQYRKPWEGHLSNKL